MRYLAYGEMVRTDYNEEHRRQSTETGKCSSGAELAVGRDGMGCRLDGMPRESRKHESMLIGKMFVGGCYLVAGVYWYYKGLCEEHVLIYVYVYICRRFINDDSR